MTDIAKLICAIEVAGIPYTFNGRRLETDNAVMYCNTEGRIIQAKRRDADNWHGLVGGDARERV